MAILTISREFGSGGREIGKAVAESLAYEYLDKERILADIRKANHKWEEWGKDLDEHCPTIWEKYDWSFRGFGALMQKIILHHAVKDRIVIMGRGGNFLLKGIEHALSIRVIAPLEARIERIIIRESVDRESARWMAERMNHERSCFLFSMYGKHWDGPEEYDRVFDTGDQQIEEVIFEVNSLLLEKDRLKTEESQETLRMRAMAAGVKAGLLTNPALFVPTLDLHYDGKALVLRGVVHSPKELKRVVDEAMKLAGDTPLRSELHFRS